LATRSAGLTLTPSLRAAAKSSEPGPVLPPLRRSGVVVHLDLLADIPQKSPEVPGFLL